MLEKKPAEAAATIMFLIMQYNADRQRDFPETLQLVYTGTALTLAASCQYYDKFPLLSEAASLFLSLPVSV